MTKDEKIRKLVARFMEGETSLDEERRLYRYFSGDGVADDLLPMRDFFRSVAVMCPSKSGQDGGNTVLRNLLSRPWFIGVAASIALLMAVGSMVFSPEPHDYCEAYIYNRHVTDPAAVMKEVDGTLQAIHQDGEASVESQLRDIFGSE